jgi:hypothetical protein
MRRADQGAQKSRQRGGKSLINHRTTTMSGLRREVQLHHRLSYEFQEGIPCSTIPRSICFLSSQKRAIFTQRY